MNIAATLEHADEISEYEKRRKPWNITVPHTPLDEPLPISAPPSLARRRLPLFVGKEST